MYNQYLPYYLAIGLLATFLVSVMSPHEKDMTEDQTFSTFFGAIAITLLWPIFAPLLMAEVGAALGRKCGLGKDKT